jgi:DNA-binding XRE family transcriptional regulator
MNDMEALKDRVASELPGATLVLRAPNPPRATAAWWLDIDHRGHQVAVEWKPKRGFGLTSPAEGFGEGADEVAHDAESAAVRVLQLLRKRAYTVSPAANALAALRQQRRLSQEELAAALHVRQAAVSKMERRADLRISTLRKAVAAMGGELKMTAEFPDGPSVPIEGFGEPE